MDRPKNQIDNNPACMIYKHHANNTFYAMAKSVLYIVGRECKTLQKTIIYN